jgi:hypothetical protein
VGDGPICIFCGAERPVEVERCPQCGRPWIDRRIAEVQAGGLAAEPSAEVLGPDEKEAFDAASRVPRWLVAGAVALFAVAVYGAVFGVILSGDGSGEAAAPPSTTTANTAVPPATTVPSISPTTAVPVPATTNAPPTTTPASSTTTTMRVPIEPIGAQIPVSELTLSSTRLGPLAFDGDGADALGRLAATFGQPDEVAPITGDLGLCADETGNAVRWGWLTALMRDEADGTATFVGVRLDQRDDVGDHPTAGILSLSGVPVGVTYARVDDVYAVVAETEVDGAPHFLVISSTSGNTSLWGPLSQAGPEGVVLGLYSPRPCDGGPVAS